MCTAATRWFLGRCKWSEYEKGHCYRSGKVIHHNGKGRKKASSDVANLAYPENLFRLNSTNLELDISFIFSKNSCADEGIFKEGVLLER